MILKLGAEEFRTATVPKTLSPDFHQLFAFPAHANPADRLAAQLDEVQKRSEVLRNAPHAIAVSLLCRRLKQGARFSLQTLRLEVWDR